MKLMKRVKSDPCICRWDSRGWTSVMRREPHSKMAYSILAELHELIRARPSSPRRFGSKGRQETAPVRMLAADSFPGEVMSVMPVCVLVTRGMELGQRMHKHTWVDMGIRKMMMMMMMMMMVH